METTLNRRNFLKGAIASGAVLVAGSALAGCASNGSSAAAEGDSLVGYQPIEFSEETDVLIVGTGIAGLSAAMDPVEAGYKVMLADKRDTYGGESFMACGVMNIAGSQAQKRAGIEGDPAEMWEKYAPVLEQKGETDDMEYKKNVYLYQTEWADRVEADYGAQFQPLDDYKDTGAPTSMLLPGRGLGDMTAVLTPVVNGLEEKGAVVVDGQGVAKGYVSNSDILRTFGDEMQTVTGASGFMALRMPDDENVRDRALRLADTDVASIATKQVVGISPDASFEDACRMLAEKRLKELPVIEDGRLVGVVRRRSLMRFVAGMLSGEVA